LPARPRHVLLVGSFVVGWSVGRSNSQPDAFVRHPPEPVPLELPESQVPARAPRLRRPARFALGGALAAVALAGAGLAVRPDRAAAPLVDPVVASRAHTQAETARITLLGHLRLAGIVGRGTGLPQPPEAQALSAPTSVPPFRVRPSDREVALAAYVQALGLPTMPGVVSAHIYGRAVDINAVGGIPILDDQGPSSITENAIGQILALPSSLTDHHNHIHIGY
jgi:hypothetical protein